MAERIRAKVYDASDVEAVYRYVNPSNWGDLIDWLRREEETNAQARRITVEEARAMREDFERLERQGKSFPTDPQALWQMVQR